MNAPAPANRFDSKKNDLIFAVTLISIIIAGALDIFPESGHTVFVGILFLMSISAFLLGLNYKPAGNRTLYVHLGFHLALLLFTFQSRLYYINIFMLSFILWHLITPFLDKYKGLMGTAILLAFFAAYIIPLCHLKFPVFPIAFYPLYLTGYKLRGIDIGKTSRKLPLICINLFFSAAALAFIYLKATSYSVRDALNLLSNGSSGPLAAIYLPFWSLFLIWFFIGIYVLAAYFIKASPNQPDYVESAEEFLNKLGKAAISFVIFFSIAGVWLFISEYVIRGSFMETLLMITDPPAMFNLFCLCSIYLFLLSLTGKTFSTILVSLVMSILAVANFIKIRYFNEPFYPWDTYLIREAITISREYVNLPLLFAVLILLLGGFSAVLAVKKPVRSFLKPKLIAPLIPFAIAALLVNGILVYSPQELAKLNIAKSWYIGKGEMLSNGLLLQSIFYFKDYNKYVLSEPEGYSKETMDEIGRRLQAEVPPAEKPAVQPNIVLIMNESFWNPTKLNGVTFSSNIMEGYDKYKKGETVSPAIGGGTANVEFEALTGLSNYFIGSGVLAYNVYFRRDTPGIVSVLNENGYNTVAIHPFLPGMYNRNKVYKYMNFDSFLSLDAFNLETDLKGPYVSDEKLVDKILETLTEGQEPKFIFAVTMQNHDPYVDKYPGLDVTVKSDKLNASELGIISTYSQGISDGAKALDKLITALEKSDTPTVVYFFGDHLPRLGSLEDMLEIYERLNPEPDIKKTTLRSYSTPYASWSNFKDMRAFETPFSPSHIAYEILRDSGVDYPGYFNVLKGLEKEHMILQKEISGQVDLSSQYIKDYRLIEYDLILGKQYLLNTDK